MRRTLAVIAASACMALAPVTAASASPSAAACWPPHYATGHASLLKVLTGAHVAVTDEISLMLSCSGIKGGGFTGREAAYLNAGDLSAPMPRGMWYWVGILVMPG
jgi:hypothetical protein